MDELRLYEYNYDKPELTDEFLEHHGILGMKWGQKNGPPYPLSSSVSTGKRLKKKRQKQRVKSLKKARKVKAQKKLETQQREKTKEEIIKSKDAVEMFKKVDLFTDQEIENLLNRISKETRLKEEATKQAEARKPKSQRIREKAVKTVKKNVSESIQNAINQALKKGTDMALKTSVRKLTEDMDPDTRKTIRKLFSVS